VRSPVTRALGTAATINTAFGILAFMLALAVDYPRGGPLGGPLGAGAWLLLTLGSGVLVGMLFLGLARLREPRDVGVSLLGTLLFGAGVGYAADLSPFIVCAVAAALVANFSPERRAVMDQLETWEPRINTVLLVMAGALLGLRTLWLVPAALVLGALRLAARWGAQRYGRRRPGAGRLRADAGLAGIAQGGVAVALGINFLLLYRGTGAPAADAVLTTVVLGVMMSQLAAPLFIIRTRGSPELTGSPAPAEVS
jgi:xanthosine utilization system XapX-like protein